MLLFSAQEYVPAKDKDALHDLPGNKKQKHQTRSMECLLQEGVLPAESLWKDQVRGDPIKV